MITRQRVSLWLIAFAATALLTGCPPAADPDASAPAPTGEAVVTESESTSGGGAGLTRQWGPDDGIPIGSYMSLTGDISTFGQSSNMAMGMAVEEINAAGGALGGQMLRLVVEDSESKPEKSSIAAKRLIDVGKVCVVVGEVASSNSIAAAPVCQAAGVPMLTPSSTNPKVTRLGDMIFRSCFTDDQQGAYVATFALRQGYRKGVILKDNNSDYSKGLSTVIEQVFTGGGGAVLSAEAYNQGEKDFNAILTKLKDLDLDVIFVPGYYTEVGLIVKQARELGLTCALLGADGWDSQALVEVAGDSLNDECYFVNHYSKDEDRPKVRDFVTNFKRRFGQDPDALAACAYDGIYIVAEALERAGGTDPKAIRDALAATADFDGVTGRITIDAERNASKPCVVLTFQNGQQVIAGTIAPEELR